MVAEGAGNLPPVPGGAELPKEGAKENKQPPPQNWSEARARARLSLLNFFVERGDILMAMAILTLGLILGIVILNYWRNLFGVGVVGFLIFFIVVIAGMFGSSGSPMDQGQIRRGVVAAWVAAFFALLAVGNGIQATGSVIANTLSQFWWAFTLVFSTYIGGRTVESVAQTWAKTKPHSR